jgi:hypothetical protein
MTLFHVFFDYTPPPILIPFLLVLPYLYKAALLFVLYRVVLAAWRAIKAAIKESEQSSEQSTVLAEIREIHGLGDATPVPVPGEGWYVLRSSELPTETQNYITPVPQKTLTEACVSALLAARYPKAS